MANLFMIDIVGTELSELDSTILQNPEVGGVILFTTNFKDKPQLKALIQSIHAVRPDIFVAVDHEGGEVQRFHRHGFFPAPAAGVYGMTYDLNPKVGVDLTKQLAYTMGKELLDCGIDVNFAPVLDLHDDGSEIIGQLSRAFHAKVEQVEILAGAFIEGMHQAGMPSIGKHFPGHGRCAADSHIAHPVNNDTEANLRALDLKPFRTLIANKQLDAVMAAHVLYPAVDKEYPAGFSKRWLQDILRDELHFEGLVMSDCLSMKGADIGDMAMRVTRSIEAGCDMLILCQQPREELLDFLNNNHFSQSPESLQRIEAFKQTMPRFTTKLNP